MKRSDQLKEQAYKLFLEQKAIAEAAHTEGRLWNEEEQAKYDKIENDYTSLQKQAEEAEKLEKRDAEYARKLEQVADANKQRLSDVKDEKEVRNAAWRKYITKGDNGLNDEERTLLRGTSSQSTSDSLGGYTIPQGMSDMLEVGLKAYGGVMDVAQIMRTSTGNLIEYPKVDDTGTSGALMTEGTAPSVSDMTFGTTNINAYLYSSGIIKATTQLIQDSAFDIEKFIGEQASIRLGRILNTHFTTGDNSSKPQGAVNGSTAYGATGTSGAISFDDILNLKHSVDPAYRKNGTFMLSDTILKEIKKLSVGSSDARPLWQSGFIAGEPDTIDGDKYVINQDMASGLADGSKIVLYGDFSKYLVRMVNNFSLVVMRERFIDALTIGYIAHVRADGRYINASTTAPVKYLYAKAT